MPKKNNNNNKNHDITVIKRAQWEIFNKSKQFDAFLNFLLKEVI